MMRLENIDRRILGAIRITDSTTARPISRSLIVAAPDICWQRNRRGDYVILEAAGLRNHRRAFMQPPAEPAAESTAHIVTVHDPQGKYLPAQHTIRLPRVAASANAQNENSIFHPIAVALYPSPSSPALSGAAIIYVTVTDTSGDPLPAVLLRVRRATNGDSEVIARGMTDWRGRAAGEALVAVSGLTVTTWDDEEDSDDDDDDTPVVFQSHSLTLEAGFDPGFDPDGSLPDPAALDAGWDNLKTAKQDINLVAGRMTKTTIEIVLT